MTVARCPKCHIEVGSTWRWCLACGYDPDGSAQRVRQAAIEARQRQGGWIPVLVVLLGLVVGGTVLWRTTPDDTTLPTESPSTAAEVDRWIAFSPPTGGFRVDLPAAPVSSPTSQASALGQPVETWVIGSGDHLFTVSVLDTQRPELGPSNPGATEEVLRAYADDLARAVSGEVTIADVTLDGPVPMVDFRVEQAIVGQLRGRALLVGPRLTSAVVTSRSLSDEIAEHVAQSLTAL